jgi:translation initiation factor 4E
MELLLDEWTFYEHVKSDKLNYEKCTKMLCTVDTVQDFWNVFNCIYNPVELFYQKDVGKPYHLENDNVREISALSLFKNGIKPTWEDPANKNGGEFVIKKFSTMDPLNHVNKLWNNLCIFAVCKSVGICGVRVIDSSQQQINKPLYRVEIWIEHVNLRHKIENELLSANINGVRILDKGDRLEFKEHA